MTPLAGLIARRIAQTGPITLADYMAECLLHPEHGYYTTRTAFGAAGDFITAPEISQMFGELLGLCLAQGWIERGRPAPALLAELGPGRGTLMADLLRATRTVPGFAEAMGVHLVEASPRLRTLQRAALGARPAAWHDSADALPEGPLFLIANEFLDALPIRQFMRDGAGGGGGGAWRERMVGLGPDGGLAFGLSPPGPGPAALAHRLADTAPGEIVEHCPAAAAVVDTVARRIAAHGGAALFVDYGGGPSRGDTFQAVAGHAPADPLAAPGTADLTAHVDFAALMRPGALPAGIAARLVAQGAFLETLGIAARAQALARNLNGAAHASHLAAYRRLTHPDEMGSLFKVLALTRADDPPLPGTGA